MTESDWGYEKLDLLMRVEVRRGTNGIDAIMRVTEMKLTAAAAARMLRDLAEGLVTDPQHFKAES